MIPYVLFPDFYNSSNNSLFSGLTQNMHANNQPSCKYDWTIFPFVPKIMPSNGVLGAMPKDDNQRSQMKRGKLVEWPCLPVRRTLMRIHGHAAGKHGFHSNKGRNAPGLNHNLGQCYSSGQGIGLQPNIFQTNRPPASQAIH